MCVGIFPAYMSLHTVLSAGQKTASHPPALELHTAVLHCVGPWDWTQVLWKSIDCLGQCSGLFTLLENHKESTVF